MGGNTTPSQKKIDISKQVSKIRAIFDTLGYFISLISLNFVRQAYSAYEIDVLKFKSDWKIPRWPVSGGLDSPPFCRTKRVLVNSTVCFSTTSRQLGKIWVQALTSVLSLGQL